MTYLNKLVQLTIILIGLSFCIVGVSVKADEKIPLRTGDSLVEQISEIGKDTNQWFSYQVKMEANNGMPCCFYNQDHQGKSMRGCSLVERTNSWGSLHTDVRVDSNTLDIYFKSNKGKVEELFVAGSECPVNKNGLSVTSFSNVSQQQSVRFLARLTNSKNGSMGIAKKISSQALAAIAYHHGDYAHQQLVRMTQKEEPSIVQNAIFWLGQARNEAGLKSLNNILNSSEFELQDKKRAVFALSVNKSQGAKEELVALAKQPTVEAIRAEAIFWVAQNNLPQALEVIDHALETNNSRALHDKAVFSLSQLKSDEAWEKLTLIANQHSNLAVQKQAVFWLSQNKSRDAAEPLIKIALGYSPMPVREHAVFALSQLTQGNATRSLVKVLQSANERKIKKKAIFWLGQSKDEEALELIESIILASN